jgi:hypothetical protein
MTLLAAPCSEIWKYLADDFLETACRLSALDRQALIESLAAEKLMAQAIEPCAGFMIEGRWIAAGREIPKELWIYGLEDRQVKKFRLVRI